MRFKFTGLLLLAVTVSGCGGGSGYMLPAINATNSATPATTSGDGSTVPANTSGVTSTGSLGSPIGSSAGIGSVDTTPILNLSSSKFYLSDGPLTFTPPAPATTGANPAASPSLGQPLNGTAFPLNQTVIALSESGVAPDSAANSGGATLSISSWNQSGDSQFRLQIPGLAVDTTFTSPTLLKGTAIISTGGLQLAASNMNYAALGIWEVDTGSTGFTSTDGVAHVGAFMTGYETPAAALPAAGTANYSGTNNVSGLLYFFPYYGGVTRGVVKGDASFSVNFASGALTGGFTNMVVTGLGVGGGSYPWNNISVSASITAGASHFSGTTAASPLTAVSFPAQAVSGSATGHIDGSFYGPHAEELGAVWSLTDGPPMLPTNPSTAAASTIVIGVVAAH